MVNVKTKPVFSERHCLTFQVFKMFRLDTQKHSLGGSFSEVVVFITSHMETNFSHEMISVMALFHYQYQLNSTRLAFRSVFIVPPQQYLVDIATAQETAVT